MSTTSSEASGTVSIGLEELNEADFDSLVTEGSRADVAVANQVTGLAFDVLGLIGRGGSADVFLVRGAGGSVDAGQYFAMKRIRKERLKPKRLKAMQEERNMMRGLTHPFIVSLHRTLETPRFLYLALTYAGGGDLSFWLDRMTADQVRVVIAEVCVALEHLHSKGIIYRDLKPENTLVGLNGHVLLADFGVSKQIASDLGDTTATIVGTPPYMAPELWMREPSYSFEVDLWAMAVMLHELLTGEVIGDARAPELRLEQVADADARDLLNRMLLVDHATRLGVGATGVAAVKAHPYFARHIHWESLLALELPAPLRADGDSMPLQISSASWASRSATGRHAPLDVAACSGAGSGASSSTTSGSGGTRRESGPPSSRAGSSGTDSSGVYTATAAGSRDDGSRDGPTGEARDGRARSATPKPPGSMDGGARGRPDAHAPTSSSDSAGRPSWPTSSSSDADDQLERFAALCGLRAPAEGPWLERMIEVGSQLALPLSISSADEPGEQDVLYVNEAFALLTGCTRTRIEPVAYRREELEGRSLRVLDGKRTEREGKRRIHVALSAGQPVTVDITSYNKANQSALHRLRVQPIDDAGRHCYTVAMQVDLASGPALVAEFERLAEALPSTTGGTPRGHGLLEGGAVTVLACLAALVAVGAVLLVRRGRSR